MQLPSGGEVSYRQKRLEGGELDVDMCARSRAPWRLIERANHSGQQQEQLQQQRQRWHHR